MFEREDTPLRRWRRSVKKIGLLAVLAGLAPALSADSHSPAELPDKPAAAVAVSAESALSALSDGFLYSDYLQNLPNLQTETTPVVSGFHGSFAVENRPSLLESIADGLPARLRQEAQSVPLRQWGLGWAIDSRRPEVTPALAAGGWRLANWLGKEVLLAATDKYGIQTLEFDLQSELGGRRAAIGVNALGALRQTERNAIAWQLSGFKSKDGVGGNVGGLYRWVTPDENHLLGANLFLDYEDYEAGAFNRWSLGGEWRSAWVDAFANVYRGITDSKLHKGERYYTADGYELEVNVHSPNVAWIAGALTYYNWKGENGDSDEDGLRFGLKFTPTLPLLLEVEYDDGDSRDNDWGGRIVYSGEFGGVQSPSVHRRNGEFIPRDFFFIAANRESTQRIRKVANIDNTVEGRYISFQNADGTPRTGDPITILGPGLTLALTYSATSAPPHYVASGVLGGATLATPQTITASLPYKVPSDAPVVTVQSGDPFAIRTSAGEQSRTLFIGSTVALAETYAHLINGRVSLSSGGESYEIRRNILTSNLTIATYDSFILPPAAIITLVSPLTDITAPIVLPTLQGVRVQRFSDNTTTIRPSSGQIVLADRLFSSPAVNGRQLTPTETKITLTTPTRITLTTYNATHRLYAQASQPLTATIRLSVLSGYRAKTEPTSGQTLTLIGDATFTLTIADPQDTQTQIFNIERDTDLGLPVPVHSNTLNLELAYSSITELTNPTFAKIPSDTVLRTFTSLTASAVPIAVLTVSGGREDNYQYRLIAGDNFEIVGGRTLQLTAPGYGLYTATVEFANDLSGVPADAAAAFREISPPVMATHTVQVTNIYDRIGGTWNIGGHPNLDDDATVTIQRVAAAAVIVGTLQASGGDGTYTYTLHGGDAAKASIDGNGVLSLPDSTALPGDIDLTVEINDTSDHTDTTQPQNQQTAPITITLLIRYMKVDDLSHTLVESGGDLRGTVLAAASVPASAATVISVNIVGGDDSAVLRRTSGNAFATNADNHIVWTPRAFGKATATMQYRDNLTGLPGGTSEKTFIVTAELIRPASLSFDGGHVAHDSQVASLTLTLYFDEEPEDLPFATLMIASGYAELGAPVFDASGDEFYALHSDKSFRLKATTRAEVSPKTGVIRINYRQTDNSKPTLINPNGHRYAVRLESAYRPITLQAFTPGGQTEIAAPVRVLTNNATVASLVATGGRAGRDLQVLAGADNFELFESDTKLRLKVADGATTPSAFRLYTVTLRYADNSGNSEELILTVDYVEETPPLALSFAGGIGNGGNVVLHRTAAGSVRIATLNIGGGLPPFVVGEKSASSDYDLANAPNTSRSRILYIPAGVEPTTGQGKSFMAEITVSDADDDASPAQSITVNVRYVKVNELASSLTDASGNPGTPLGTVYVFSESVLSTLRTKLTEMKTTGGSAVERDFLVLEAHKDGREIISDRDRDYEIGHTANAADADLYFTPRDGYGTYSVVFKMRDSSVFGDGMIARAGFSPPTKQTLTVHARPIIVSVFAGHRPDRSNHASTVGLTHLPLQSTVIQLTVTARHDLVLTRAVLASNFITVAQINAPPGITYHGFADYLQRLIPPNADHPPDGGRINIVRLGPQSGQDPISPTGQTFTLIMTARIGNNVGPEVATVRMEVKFESALGLDFVAPDSTDGTGDPKTLWRGVRFHSTAPVVVASAVLGGGTNPALSALPSDSDFQLLADNKIGLLPDRFGTYSLTVRATEDGGLTAETALTITVQPLYEIYVGDQKIDDPGGNIRFTVSVAAEPITSPVRVAQFRFLGEGAASHCTGFSSGNDLIVNFQKEGAICHMVVVPQSPAVTPDNRALISYVNVGTGNIHPGLNRLLLDRNITVQLAPKLALRLTDRGPDPSTPNVRTGAPFEVINVAGLGGDPSFPFSVVVASVVLGGKPGSNPQIDPIPSDSNFKLVADNKIAFVRPTRFGNHTLTLRARETAGANPLSAETKLTVNVNRLYRAFVGDRELAENATGKYDITVSSTFNKEITAPLALAQLRYIGDKAAAHCASSSTLDSAVSNFGLVRQGAICNVVLNPSNPALTPDNQKISDSVGVAEPTSPPKAANEFYYRTTRTFNIEIVPRYDPIKLTLVGPFGGGTAHEVVFERDTYFGRIVGGGGNSTDASPLTFSQVGGGDKIEFDLASSGRFVDLELNVGENEYGEFKITVQANDTLDSTPPALITATVTRTDIPFSVEDQRGNIIEPVLESNLYKVAVTVYGPDTPTWGSAATLVFLNIYVPSDGLLHGTSFSRSGNRLRTQTSTPLAVAPGNVQTGLFTVISGTDVNGNGGSPAATVEVKATFIRVADLALAVRKPTAAATPAEPVRWFTEFASAASLVASLEATGGGEGTRAVITAAPPGDIFALSNDNILSFKPPAKGIYTLTLAAMDNIGTTPANQTVTVAYGDPIVAQMNSGGHDDSVQNGTLSNGGTVIFHNYFASAGRTGTTDLPIATLVASGGVGARTFTWQDTSTGTPGNDSGYVVVSNGILWLNRFHDDSSGNPVNSPGTGRAIESTPEFAATITVDDGFDASPPVLLSITGAAFQHRRPANKPDPENPRIQLETGGNVFALHTETGETPILTLGLPSTAAIDTTNGFVVATVRVGGGYDSKRFSRVDGSSSSDMDVRNPSNDGDDELREVILRNNVTNLADFPADANGESNTRSVVITYKTRYLGRDFFDASIQEPHEATISLKFKIKKMTATRESKDLIAAANAAIPATLVTGNPIREASDNSGNIDIARTDNTLTYAGLTVAKMTYKNLVGLGGKIPLSDLLVANANSILTVTAGSAEGEFFVKTRVPAAHAASNPFTPAIGGANIDGGFVANATRYATPTPFSVEIFVAPAFGGGTRNVKIPAPYEIPGGAVGFRAVAAGGGAGGTNVQMRFDWGYSAGNQVFEPNGAHANRKIFDLNTGGGGNPRARFFVHDTNPAGLPSGVDFTPERQIDIAFTRRGSATDISCQNGGTGGITQLFTDPGNVVVGRLVNSGNDFRLNLGGGLIAQGAVNYRKALNIYVRATSTGAGVGSRYNQCEISEVTTPGRRTQLLCGITDAGSGFTNAEVAVQAGDVVMAAPGPNSAPAPEHPMNFGKAPAHFDAVQYIRNARKAQGGRSAVHYNAERHANFFRVYHKPGELKPTASDQLEFFLAKGEEDDINDGCQGVDLADDGSEGFYLNSRFIRTYKWRDAATNAELDARRVITSNTGRPQATDPSTFSCREGGNIGGNTQIYTGASGPVGGGFATRTDLHLGLTSQAGAAFQRILNIFISHTATSAGGTHRYSRCRIFGNSRQHIVCNLTFPHHGQANPMSPVYAGDIVLVAPTAKAGFNVIHNGIRYDTTGTGKFDNVLNLIAQRDQSAADERNMNLFRVYSRPGVQRPGDSNQLELFLARGVEGGHEGDYAPTCAAEDLPDGGNRFYLTSAGVRTYKASEAAPESAFRDRVPNGQRPRPAP